MLLTILCICRMRQHRRRSDKDSHPNSSYLSILIRWWIEIITLLPFKYKSTAIFIVATFRDEFHFFATFMVVCDVYGCLRRLWLFATFMVVCDVYGCLRRLWLFATFMVVCDVYGCLRRLWLFATFMVVCDVYGCLRRLWLFATFMVVCDVYGCLGPPQSESHKSEVA